MTNEDIIRHRIGLPGPPGHTISGPDWLDVTTRLAAVEAVADTTNPFGLVSGTAVSSSSHGLGGAQDATETMVTTWMLFTPIFLSHAVEVDRMLVYVDTPATGGILRLGLYGKAGALVYDFGTVSTDTPGWKGTLAAANPTAPRGMSWLAVSSNNVAGIGIWSQEPAFALFHHIGHMQRYATFAGTHDGATALPGTMAYSGFISNVPYLGLGIA